MVDLTCSSSATSRAKAAALPPAAVISLYQFVQFFLITRGDGHGCAAFGEALGDGASDALGCAGDEGYSS